MSGMDRIPDEYKAMMRQTVRGIVFAFLEEGSEAARAYVKGVMTMMDPEKDLISRASWDVAAAAAGPMGLLEEERIEER